MARWELQQRDTATLEERRLNAGSLLHSGISQAEVARHLAVSAAAACKWNRAPEERESCTLRTVPRPGRPTNVPRTQLAKLSRILAPGALSYGFSADLWTIPRILDVTEAEWGVRYDKNAIWRLQKRHGLSW